MFGLNESTQFYVCQRYVRMNMSTTLPAKKWDEIKLNIESLLQV